VANAGCSKKKRRLHDPDVSRGMLLAVFVGIIAGLGAVLFRSMISMVHQLAFEGGKEVLSGMGAYYVVLVPSVGGLIVGPLISLKTASSA
jgi:H+/Cl- antiporter ClcA